VGVSEARSYDLRNRARAFAVYATTPDRHPFATASWVNPKRRSQLTESQRCATHTIALSWSVFFATSRYRGGRVRCDTARYIRYSWIQLDTYGYSWIQWDTVRLTDRRSPWTELPRCALAFTRYCHYQCCMVYGI